MIVKAKLINRLSVKKYSHLWPFLGIFLFSFLLILGQLLSRGIIVGSDFLFHYNRFYESSQQIKTGNFSYFISLFSFNGSARIVNAFYGSYFAYFQGLLLLLSRNWFTYQLISRFTLGVIAGLSMYSLLKRAKTKTATSFWLALLFMTSFSTQYWTFRQGFSSWGAAFFPWCLIPIVDLLKNKHFNTLRLAVSVALLLQIHTLSTIFLVLVYIPFYLVGFLHSHTKKQFLIKMVQSILISLLLSANVLASFAEVVFSNSLVEPFINKSLYQSTVTSRGIQWLLTPFPLLLIMLLLLILALRHWKNYDTLLKLTLSTALVFFILSSSFFPWFSINKLNLSIVNLIQFPFRFFIPTTILILLAVALIITNYSNKKYFPAIQFLLILSVCIGFAQINTKANHQMQTFLHSNKPIAAQKHQFLLGNNQEIRKAFFSNDLNDLLNIAVKSTPDYLPYDEQNKENKYVLYEHYILNNPHVFKRNYQKGKIVLNWYSKTNNYINLPIVKYKNTELMLNQKKLKSTDYSLTAIHSPKVRQKVGNNQLIISYKTPFWFYILLFSNILLWLSLVIIYCYRKLVNRRLHRTQKAR